MASAHEHGVSGRYRFPGDTLARKAGFEIGKRNLLADVEHAPLETLDVEKNASGEERRRVFNPKFLQPIGRDHMSDRRLPL